MQIFFICSIFSRTANYKTINKDISSFLFPGNNLIIISLSNVGTEHMSLYGYKRKTTPFIDNWSKDAIVFENFYSPASWTLPVATSLMTSLQPFSHKIMFRLMSNILDPKLLTLPEILKKSGYQTACFTGGLDYDHEFGHMRGFKYFIRNPLFTSLKITTNQALSWLETYNNKKFFLFIHGYDTHPPFVPPSDIRGKFSSITNKKIVINPNYAIRGYFNNENDKYEGYYFEYYDIKKISLTKDDIDYLCELYDEEILYEDRIIENFIKGIDKNILDKTIIIIMAEHGEMFGKHGRFGRTGTDRGTHYDEVLHVPLIMKLPKSDPKKVTGLVQMIDLMPTILSILGLPLPEYLQGKNLLPMLENGTDINKYIYTGSIYTAHPSYYRYNSITESIQDLKWKLIHEMNKNASETLFPLLDYEQTSPINFIDFEKVSNFPYTRLQPNSVPIDPFLIKNVELINKDLEYWKNIDSEKYELYNLETDPDELVNLVEKESVKLNELKEALENSHLKELQFNIQNIKKELFDQKMTEFIKEHGYW